MTNPPDTTTPKLDLVPDEAGIDAPAPRPASHRTPGRRVSERAQNWILRAVAIAVFLGGWELVSRYSGVNPLFFPPPSKVAQSFVGIAKTPSFWTTHVWVTLKEILLGFLAGCTTGVVLGILITRSRVIESVLEPFILATQMIPKLALAPLLVVWFGFGILPRLITVALITFFPLLVNTILGIRSADAEQLDLFRVIHASSVAVFLKLELPGALPVMFGGFKVAIVLSTVGATVAEFIGSSEGLGALIIGAMGSYDVSLMFGILGLITAIGMCFYGLLSFVERRMLSWHESVWLHTGER